MPFGLLAQLVEQRPFKAWVLGSSPRRATSFIYEIIFLIRFNVYKRLITFLLDAVLSAAVEAKTCMVQQWLNKI